MTDLALEIGPGRGILTTELLARAKKVVAIEKDAELVEVLGHTFAKEIKEGKLTVIDGDALSVTPQSLGLASGSFVLAANIPYYISGEILREYVSGPVQPKRAALLVQKEVAERIVEKDGKGSLLSLSIKLYGEPRYLRTIKAGAFNPPPKVDSAVLLIDAINREKLAGIDEKALFSIAKIAFGQKRKQIFGSLKGSYDENIVKNALQKCAIDPAARPETLATEAWGCLSKQVA